MLDPVACYGEYLHVSLYKAPNTTGTKRGLDEENPKASTQAITMDTKCVSQPKKPQIASVFIQNRVVPIQLPEPVSTCTSAFDCRHTPSGRDWPPNHAGLFREYGGVKSYIQSLSDSR
jgi:hypothetical protein